MNLKVLIATPEYDPLTGSTPVGQIADRLSRELHRGQESDVIVAIPALENTLRAFADQLVDTGAVITAASGPQQGPTAQVFEYRRSDSEAQVFLLDSPELRQGFGEDLADEVLASRCLLWSRFLANLATRLKPRVHVMHAFGWESALVAPMIRARRLACRTIVTTIPTRGPGPTLGAVKNAVHRSGVGELASINSEAGDRPLLSWTGGQADKVTNLAEITPEDWSPSDVIADPASAIRTKQRSREMMLAPLGGDDRPSAPLFYVPTANPGALLPFLDRLLEAGTRVVAEGSGLDGDPATESALLSAQRRHRGRFFLLKAADEDDRHEWLAASDFVLLLPDDGNRPESAATVTLALTRGCTPILPLRDHFRPVVSDLETEGESPVASFYVNEEPEAVWSLLKRVIRLHADPECWREQVQQVVRAGLAEEGVSPGFADLYREVVEASLAVSA